MRGGQGRAGRMWAEWRKMEDKKTKQNKTPERKKML